MPSTVSKKISKTKKMILFEKKSRANSCNIMDSPYLCIVFFIVLDLRLTRLGYSGIPFFFALTRLEFLEFLGFLESLESLAPLEMP